MGIIAFMDSDHKLYANSPSVWELDCCNDESNYCSSLTSLNLNRNSGITKWTWCDFGMSMREPEHQED